MLAEFTTAINEFAGIVGYSAIILSVAYGALKIAVALVKRK